MESESAESTTHLRVRAAVHVAQVAADKFDNHRLPVDDAHGERRRTWTLWRRLKHWSSSMQRKIHLLFHEVDVAIVETQGELLFCMTRTTPSRSSDRDARARCSFVARMAALVDVECECTTDLAHCDTAALHSLATTSATTTQPPPLSSMASTTSATASTAARTAAQHQRAPKSGRGGRGGGGSAKPSRRTTDAVSALFSSYGDVALHVTFCVPRQTRTAATTTAATTSSATAAAVTRSSLSTTKAAAAAAVDAVSSLPLTTTLDDRCGAVSFVKISLRFANKEDSMTWQVFFHTAYASVLLDSIYRSGNRAMQPFAATSSTTTATTSGVVYAGDNGCLATLLTLPSPAVMRGYATYFLTTPSRTSGTSAAAAAAAAAAAEVAPAVLTNRVGKNGNNNSSNKDNVTADDDSNNDGEDNGHVPDTAALAATASVTAAATASAAATDVERSDAGRVVQQTSSSLSSSPLLPPPPHDNVVRVAFTRSQRTLWRTCRLSLTSVHGAPHLLVRELAGRRWLWWRRDIPGSDDDGGGVVRHCLALARVTVTQSDADAAAAAADVYGTLFALECDATPAVSLTVATTSPAVRHEWVDWLDNVTLRLRTRAL